MRMKSIAYLLMLVVSLSLLAGCGQAKQAATKSEPREIRVGYQTGSSIVILAKSKGWYEEEFSKDGIQVKYNLFLAGPPMNEALAGDRLDIASVGNLPAISAKSAGIDAKVIGRASSDKYYYGLLTGPDSSIHAVSDLRGKKIAVQIGSGAHLFLALLLQQNGLKSTYVNIVNLPAPDHQTALETKNVDAVAAWQPWVATIEHAGVGKLLVDSSKVVQSVGVYLARNTYAKNNGDLVERFLKVHQKAADYIKNHPQEAIEIISKETKIPVAALTKSYQTIDWGLAITDDDVKTLKNSKDFLIETNVLKKDFDVNELIDKTYLNNIGIK